MPRPVTPPGSGRRAAACTWLFDLDNTLHDASPHIFPHINRAMRAYIERELGLDAATANRLRQEYWTRYGATLLGLMRHHGTDPRHFLWHTHQFDDLAAMARWRHGLDAVLRRLPGRKILFSNAPRHYARAILDLIGVARAFDAVYSVESLRFQPKPSPDAFRILLARERLDPRRCILVEDTLANLLPARRLGMRTVWVTRSLRGAPAVDLRVRSVHELPRRLAGLGLPDALSA